MRSWLALLLASAPLLAQEPAADIQFFLFSGRKRPEAKVVDPAQIGALQAGLAVCLARPVACAEIPPQPSTPAYTGLLLGFSPPVPGADGLLIVRDGYAYLDQDHPCYADSGRKLESLAAGIAFGLDDVNALGGPKPMTYLACMVPPELHPEAAPCSASVGIWDGIRVRPDAGSRPVDAEGRAFDGIRVPRSPLFRAPAP